MRNILESEKVVNEICCCQSGPQRFIPSVQDFKTLISMN